MITIYGIKNCDTVKKACQWLDDNRIVYHFHDVRKKGLSAKMLRDWENALGWEKMLNKRSTTWKGLSEDLRKKVNKETAIALMLENPTLIKRPLLDMGESKQLGFKPDEYEAIFAGKAA